MKNNIGDCHLGQLHTYCYLVERGKPAAMLSIQKRHIKEAVKVVEDQYNLSVFTEPNTKDWVVLWVYKYSHMLDVIKRLPQKPKTKYDHWVLGKAFGYSEEAIKEFITKHI